MTCDCDGDEIDLAVLAERERIGSEIMDRLVVLSEPFKDGEDGFDNGYMAALEAVAAIVTDETGVVNKIPRED